MKKSSENQMLLQVGNFLMRIISLAKSNFPIGEPEELLKNLMA